MIHIPPPINSNENIPVDIISDQKIKYFMDVANLTAKQSYSKRLTVGCVLVRDKRIIAEGRNGTISGMDNNCETEIEKDGATYLVTKDTVLHAEQNLLMMCAKHGISTNNTTLYLTHSPCIMCSKLIAQSGIERVIYEYDYRDKSGIRFLQDCNVIVEQYKELADEFE